MFGGTHLLTKERFLIYFTKERDSLIYETNLFIFKQAIDTENSKNKYTRIQLLASRIKKINEVATKRIPEDKLREIEQL